MKQPVLAADNGLSIGDNPMTNLNVDNLTLIIAVLIPLLTGALTKYHASAQLKAVATLTLSVAAAAVQVLIDHGGHVIAKDWVSTTVVTYVVAIAGYYGLLKPSQIAEKVKLLTYDFGVGDNPQPPAADAAPPDAPKLPFDPADLGDAH